MTTEKKIRIDKLASSTVNVRLETEISITHNIEPEIGNVCIVRALEEKRVYDKLELSTGRMAKISKGDIKRDYGEFHFDSETWTPIEDGEILKPSQGFRYYLHDRRKENVR